ncbi:MAG TPA: dihydrofolate reductase family protein [Anaeromyxobacteraceae bacterium]|nr:dihydrofolate reductase family protein [Anaeromyxobacteraceae bacterium]
MFRPTCSVFVGMSLDGFIAGPGGALDWLKPFEGEEHGYQAFFDAVDAVVIGRGTYDVVLGFASWPYGKKRVFVLTHHPATARHGELFLGGAPESVVARLAADGVRRAYVDGGAVVSQFLAAGLVDDLTLTLVPVVLGDGIRLFQAPLPTRPFRLAGARTFPSGLVQVRYLAAGEARRARRKSPRVAGRRNASAT